MGRLRVNSWVESEIMPDGAIKLDYSVLEDKPVYTKEMQEDGELPPVGCKCLHTGLINDFENTSSLNEGDELEVLMHYEGGVVFRKAYHDDYGLVVSHTCNPVHFKPIKTEQEKLIDDIGRYVFNNSTVPSAESCALAELLALEFNITRKGESND